MDRASKQSNKSLLWNAEALCWMKKSSDGSWRRARLPLPKWALSKAKFRLQFIRLWSQSESIEQVMKEFHWLSLDRIEWLRIQLSDALVERGCLPLEPLPFSVGVELDQQSIEELIEEGCVKRVTPVEILELEEYDVVQAMLDAQSQNYYAEDPQHIQIGEVGSMRFRAKR